MALISINSAFAYVARLNTAGLSATSIGACGGTAGRLACRGGRCKQARKATRGGCQQIGRGRSYAEGKAVQAQTPFC